ncbi:MAG: hypothetical protein KKD39_07295, partial [Candidatus Altiarchaeota archaeon]|nr:hypothetical protein [Candidatus Altiarchaeota archaeon]
GFGLMLYEVLGGDAENKTAVGGIAYSSGLDDTYRVLLHMQEEVNGTFNVSYVYLGNLSLSGGQLSEVMYYIENKSGNECLFRLERANGYASRLRGRLDLVNKGKEGDLTLRIRLIDQGRNEVAGSYVKKVSLGRGENFSVDYSFDNVEPYNTYALDFDSSGGVLLDSRGVESSVDTALFLEAFC